MDTIGAHLDTPLRTLALGLAAAHDAGHDTRTVLRYLVARWPGTLDDPGIVEDVVLAASSLLAGVDPHLTELRAVWGRPRLHTVATLGARLVEQIHPGS